MTENINIFYVSYHEFKKRWMAHTFSVCRSCWWHVLGESPNYHCSLWWLPSIKDIQMWSIHNERNQLNILMCICMHWYHTLWTFWPGTSYVFLQDRPMLCSTFFWRVMHIFHASLYFLWSNSPHLKPIPEGHFIITMATIEFESFSKTILNHMSELIAWINQKVMT